MRRKLCEESTEALSKYLILGKDVLIVVADSTFSRNVQARQDERLVVGREERSIVVVVKPSEFRCCVKGGAGREPGMACLATVPGGTGGVGAVVAMAFEAKLRRNLRHHLVDTSVCQEIFVPNDHRVIQRQM